MFSHAIEIDLQHYLVWFFTIFGLVLYNIWFGSLQYLVWFSTIFGLVYPSLPRSSSSIHCSWSSHIQYLGNQSLESG